MAEARNLTVFSEPLLARRVALAGFFTFTYFITNHRNTYLNHAKINRTNLSLLDPQSTNTSPQDFFYPGKPVLPLSPFFAPLPLPKKVKCKQSSVAYRYQCLNVSSASFLIFASRLRFLFIHESLLVPFHAPLKKFEYLSILSFIVHYQIKVYFYLSRCLLLLNLHGYPSKCRVNFHFYLT